MQDSNLGLPQLPQLGSGSGGSSSLTSLLTGSHTLRVWYAGQDKQRVALLGSLGETDVVRNGTNAWLWASDSNSATHYAIPAGKAGKAEADQLPAGVTPQQAADAALTALDPTTEVSTSSTTSVAGRSAYELVLAPKDTRSLVGQVRLAVDSSDLGAAAGAGLRPEQRQRAGVLGRLQLGQLRRAGGGAVHVQPAAGGEGDRGLAAGRPAARRAGEAQRPATRSRPSAPAGPPSRCCRPAAPRTRRPGRRRPLGAFLEQLPKVSGSWGSGRLLSLHAGLGAADRRRPAGRRHGAAGPAVRRGRQVTGSRRARWPRPPRPAARCRGRHVGRRPTGGHGGARRPAA